MGQALQALRAGFMVIRALLHIPIWLVFFLQPANRPCPRWSLLRSVYVRIVQYTFRTGFPSGHLDILLPTMPWGYDQLIRPENIAKPNARKDGAIVIPPPQPKLVPEEIKDIAKRNGVAVDLPVVGYWYGERLNGLVGSPARPEERVILNLHGGGFIFDTAAAHSIASKWVHRVRKKTAIIKRTFMPEYRISGRRFPSDGGATNPFPAALLDCLASYTYLLSIGFKPENIVLMGDSAGGNLALSLVHLLPSVGLAVPGRVVLLSPAADGQLTHVGPTASSTVNAMSDYCYPLMSTGMCIDPLRGDALSREWVSTSMWLSPGARDISATDSSGWFAGLRNSRTMILAGGAECSVDGMRVLRDRIVADVGKEESRRVVYHEEPDATHDWPNISIWEPEGELAINAVVQFIEDGQ